MDSNTPFLISKLIPKSLAETIELFSESFLKRCKMITSGQSKDPQSGATSQGSGHLKWGRIPLKYVSPCPKNLDDQPRTNKNHQEEEGPYLQCEQVGKYGRLKLFLLARPGCSHSSVVKKLSHNASSYQSPVAPIEGRTPPCGTVGLPSEPCRGFCKDLPFLSQLPVLAAQSSDLLPLLGGRTVTAAARIQFRIAWADGPNSRDNSWGVRPTPTSSTICGRSSRTRIEVHIAQSADNTSACSSTVRVAFSRLSGG